MHLPLKYAASVPLTAVVVIALAVALTTEEGRKLHPVYGLPNAGFAAFLAGIPALLLVPPNLASAFLANRFGGDNALLFFAILSMASVGCCLAMALATNSAFRTMGGAFDLGSWQTYAAIAANAVLLSFAGFLYGARSD
jgi:hypothetical protein